MPVNPLYHTVHNSAVFKNYVHVVTPVLSLSAAAMFGDALLSQARLTMVFSVRCGRTAIGVPFRLRVTK